jgi:TonB-linked SusC/RagA family outer membrane protein
MQMSVHGKKPPIININKPKRMFLLFLLVLLSFPGISQGISLSLKKTSLEKAFREIESKVEQRFVYTREMMDQSRPVSISVKNASLQKVLELLFTQQPLEYLLDENFIKVRFKATPVVTVFDIQGKVLGEHGNPLVGATALIKGRDVGTVTDDQGIFYLKDVSQSDILVISNIGYSNVEIPILGKTSFDIRLQLSVTSLDETIIIAYGTSTQRLSTGNISRVNAKEISNQPSANPLAFLQGRVPGLVVTQSNGLPGSSFKIQIRGRNSIAQGSDPLFIVDGVPYAPGNGFLNQISSAIGVNSSVPSFSSGLSPFSLINPSDIESIEVLKDADATAIYGSRGANGVVLITTKKGKEGKTRVSINLNTGWGKATRTMNMLNTGEYVRMREEAFLNDGLTPNMNVSSPGYAPDLLIWDTTSYSDFKKLLIGGTAKISQAQASFSGGSANTQFLLGSTYRYQSTVFPGDFADKQTSFHLNLNHSSTNQKFHSLFTTNYSSDRNNLLKSDLSVYLNLPPNLPPLFDDGGKLKWEDQGVSYALGNPYAELLRKYSAQSENLISNLLLDYQILRKISLKTSLGYNTLSVDEKSLNPAASYDPQLNVKGSSFLANTFSRSWIIEPQAEYYDSVGNGKITALIGTTFQEITNRINTIAALDYTSDILLESIASAGRVIAQNTVSQYRYNALFGRINYNYSNKYLINLSGRRDGSSRFGPGRQIANFGAVGAGWIFTKENLVSRSLDFLSFGKLRASYGSSGNDQIGDYQYLDSWVSTANAYQGISGITPTRLFNPDYSWEYNRKLEAGLELGFLQDRLFFSASYYSNRSSNQLVSYPLPTQTGFASVNKNLEALVQNVGSELIISYRSNNKRNFQWETNVNFTRQRNKLVSFPGLASSSYARTYVEGKSLSVLQGYNLIGVDPGTGIYLFEDIDKDNSISYPKDYAVFGNLDPGYFGGLSTTLLYKKIELYFLLEYRNQQGRNYQSILSLYPPGQPYNQPSIILNHWQKPGDNTAIQKFSTNNGSSANQAIKNLLLSDGLYSDASYLRGKTMSISFYLPGKWLKKIKAESGKLYLQGLNFFTVTHYKGNDPETQNFYALPPLRLIVSGLNITF